MKQEHHPQLGRIIYAHRRKYKASLVFFSLLALALVGSGLAMIGYALQTEQGLGISIAYTVFSVLLAAFLIFGTLSRSKDYELIAENGLEATLYGKSIRMTWEQIAGFETGSREQTTSTPGANTTVHFIVFHSRMKEPGSPGEAPQKVVVTVPSFEDPAVREALNLVRQRLEPE